MPEERVPPEANLRNISKSCLFLTICISIISLLGWAFGLLIMASLHTDYIPIAPSTSLTLAILSSVLLAYEIRPESAVRRKAAFIGIFLTLSICLSALVLFSLGRPFQIEHWGFDASQQFAGFPVGHMSPVTAVTLLAASLGTLSLVLSFKGNQWLKNTASYLAMSVIASGFVVSTGYLYGTPLLYGGNIIPVALPSAVAFLLFGMGLITASGPAVPPVRVFMDSTVRSQLMRAFFPMIFTFAVFYGLVYRTVFSRAGNPALIASSVAILSVIVISLAASKIARSVGTEIDRANAERTRAETEREKLIVQLQDALANIKTLQGMLPICASCKKIRDDSGYWNQIEVYITKHSEAEFTHGLCPDCYQKSCEELDEFRKKHNR